MWIMVCFLLLTNMFFLGQRFLFDSSARHNFILRAQADIHAYAVSGVYVVVFMGIIALVVYCDKRRFSNEQEAMRSPDTAELADVNEIP